MTRFLWRSKGTLLVQAVIITVGFLTRNQSAIDHERLLERFGFSYAILRDGKIWQLLTGAWIQSTPGIEVSMVALVLCGTIVLEHQAGTLRMIATVVVGDWISTVLTPITLRLLAGLGSAEAAGLLSRADAGTSALAHTGLAAATMLLPRRWRWIAASALVIFTLAQFFTESLAPAIAHTWAVLAGGLIGWFLSRCEAGSQCHSRCPPVADIARVSLLQQHRLIDCNRPRCQHGVTETFPAVDRNRGKNPLRRGHATGRRRRNGASSSEAVNRRRSSCPSRGARRSMPACKR